MIKLLCKHTFIKLVGVLAFVGRALKHVFAAQVNYNYAFLKPQRGIAGAINVFVSFKSKWFVGN